MRTSLFKEEHIQMPEFLNKLAEDNAYLINKKDVEKKYGKEDLDTLKYKSERIVASKREVIIKEADFDKIETEITSSLNYLLNNGYSIDEVQQTLSNKYSNDITKRYLRKNANYILKAYGLLGNICLDANSLENNIKISDYISKISSKNPIQIKFIISKDKIKFANIGYKIIDSLDEIKLSYDEAKLIISKITNNKDYIKLANKNPLEAVKASYRDLVENRRFVKRTTKEIDKPKEYISTIIDDKKSKLENDKKEIISKLKNSKDNFNKDLHKIANAVISHIENGNKIILSNDQFTEKGPCLNFKNGFEVLTNEVFKIFNNKYGVKLSHIGIASSFLIKADKCGNCSNNKNNVCILTGIKQSSFKSIVKTANYNFNNVFKPCNMKLSDLPKNEEIYELDMQKLMNA